MRKILAAAAALVIALAPLTQAAEVPPNTTTASGKPPAVTPAGLWDGTTNRIWAGDSDGNGLVRLVPAYDIIPHRINVTLASAATDSSLLPFPVSQYRALKIQFRLKAASFAAGAAIVFAVKFSNAAQLDSTALGYWTPMGNGLWSGKTRYFPDLTTRWIEIPVADSLTNMPGQDLYASIKIQNLTGAQIIYDANIKGIR